MPKPLPENPSLEQLKKQAKDLLKSLKSETPEALQRAQRNHPTWSGDRPSNARTTNCKLSDAQVILAREYGFESWAKLKQHVTARELASANPLELFHKAFREDDAPLMESLFKRYPEMKARVNEPLGPFDSPAITAVRSRKMLDVLLGAGADINAKSRWWAGGFGLLHCATPELAAYAINRGAEVDIHAAARLGMMDRLREWIVRDPALVHARGGDGQTPLHFASTVEIAAFLLDHGADIDARDVDHESTPAQYMIGERQEIARYLVERGCKADLLMAAALGDRALAERLLAADPACIRIRVSDEYFPMINPRTGGSIYQWTLGWYVSAPRVAKKFGHEDLARWLWERSPVELQLIEACWMGDAASVGALQRSDPDLSRRFSESDRRQLVHAVRNNDSAAARLFLKAGLPVDSKGQHGATPLHWAAWHGNSELVECILALSPPLEATDDEFHGTPLRWAVHGSENGWHREQGYYGKTVELLINAGAKLPDKLGGTAEVQAALRQRMDSGA